MCDPTQLHTHILLYNIHNINLDTLYVFYITGYNNIYSMRVHSLRTSKLYEGRG